MKWIEAEYQKRNEEK